ncbi:MAG: hypothetical protein ACREA2_19920 [Blastocatellia bacterium]
MKEAYEKIRDNYREAFPHLPTYQRWIIRLHELDPLIGELLIASTALFMGEASFHLIDSKPIQLCHPLRHGRVRLLRDEGAYLILDETGILLLTRADTPDHKKLLSQVRQQIETTFSQLWYKFIDRVFSRSWRGLWNTLRLKVLFYNLCHAGAISL